jgi:hypothetical protein
MWFGHPNRKLGRYVQPVIRIELSKAFCGFAGRSLGIKKSGIEIPVVILYTPVCLSVCLSFCPITHIFPDWELIDEEIYFWICSKSD